MTPFEEVAALLPLELRNELFSMPKALCDRAEELRLRVGFTMSIAAQGQENFLSKTRNVRMEDLYAVLEQASHHSVHTVLERMRSGFVTVSGGHRIGLCGLAAAEEGKNMGFRQLSSLNLRIAREIRGEAVEIVPKLMEGGTLQNTLIVAPPGTGKTTLLRDMIRCVSDGDSVPAQRVGVADERGEIGALWDGTPQMELGRRTDILEGIPKAEGLLMLLRGMNPQVLAVDEITDPTDVEAIVQAAGCGVALLATAHGTSIKGMELRPVYRELFRQNIFRRVVLIRCAESGTREIRVEEIPWFK